MEEVEHNVNYRKKRLRIGPKGGKAKSVIQGLTAEAAEEFSAHREVELERKRALENLKISLDSDPCEDMEVLIAEIVSEEEYQSDCAAIWMELSNMESSKEDDDGKPKVDLMEFDRRIRAEYPDLFEEPTGLPPERKSGGFRIRLIPGTQPPHKSPYRMTPTELKEYQLQILALCDRRAIQRSRSPYAAPAIFVPKPGTIDPETGKPKLRMVYDYQFLNRITVKDRFPHPLPEDLLNKLEEHVAFPRLISLAVITSTGCTRMTLKRQHLWAPTAYGNGW
jgi:hypothetical protein